MSECAKYPILEKILTVQAMPPERCLFQDRDHHRRRTGARPCVRLKSEGQTARVLKKAGTTTASFVPTPVNFASLCAGGGALCASSSYASVATGQREALGPSGGGGATLCGR